MSSTYYTICTGDGGELTTGIQLCIEAERAAQSHADRIGQAVYLSGPDADDEEFTPAVDETAPPAEAVRS